MSKSISCDVLVIGGGSGGLACAQALGKKNQKVVICDFVKPSESYLKTTWGFGGTCVNVGCVPKKLFHRAGFFGQTFKDGEIAAFGFEQQEIKVANWDQVVTTVQNHVKMLNFIYRTHLPANCTYVKGLATFHRGNEGFAIHIRNIQKNKDDEIIVIQPTKAIVIAVGGRPIIPSSIPGAKEFGISSDDIFSLKSSPNKTLVVGSSYIGLETASFLNAMSFETTLLIRSRPLRSQGFDPDCAEKIVELLKDSGVKIKHGDLQKLEKIDNNKTLATFKDGTSEYFNTVLFGTGRRPETRELKLPENIIISRDDKIMVNSKNFIAGKLVNDSGPTIYAIGDCALTNSPELTPVAIRQGELVATHIVSISETQYEQNEAKRLRALDFVPSTVFTLPSEYSRIGLSEHEAIEKYGENNIEVYLREWQPLEAGAAHVKSLNESFKNSDGAFRSFVKLICLKTENERIIGLHLISPSAAESIHGLALACSLGATKSDLDARVLGIHPTDAEGLTDLSITKLSKLSYQVSSGCGGGKCG